MKPEQKIHWLKLNIYLIRKRNPTREHTGSDRSSTAWQQRRGRTTRCFHLLRLLEDSNQHKQVQTSNSWTTEDNFRLLLSSELDSGPTVMKPEEKCCGSQQQVQPGYTPPCPAHSHSFKFSTLMSEKIKFTHDYTAAPIFIKYWNCTSRCNFSN